MKFLVTGAPGWLGDRFVKSLEGQEITCLVHPDLTEIFKRNHPKTPFVAGDFTRPGSLPDFFENSKDATLFHLAGLVHATRGVKQFFEVNTEGTRNLLDHAARAGVKRIIAISSNSPIGCNPSPNHLFTEDSPYHPYMAYGRSKMQMEHLIQDAFRQKKLETTILRPCWFYGPGQPPRQTLFFSMIKEGKGPIVGGGESKRSMSYVDNVCQALRLAAGSSRANGQIYWIADSRPYTMNEIIDTVERLLENEFKIPVAHKRLQLPGFVSEIAGMADGALQAVGIYHQKIHVLSEMNKTIAASVEKAKTELGYCPTVQLEEGMRRSIAWCLENGHKI